MTKILVTGGLGFIGSNLVKILLSKKYNVLNIDKVTYASNFYNVREFKNIKKYKFIKCDINIKTTHANILPNVPGATGISPIPPSVAMK